MKKWLLYNAWNTTSQTLFELQKESLGFLLTSKSADEPIIIYIILINNIVSIKGNCQAGLCMA